MGDGIHKTALEDYGDSKVPYYLNMCGPESKKQAWAQEPGNIAAMTENTTSMAVKNAKN